jgi:hypothetical protein
MVGKNVINLSFSWDVNRTSFNFYRKAILIQEDYFISMQEQPETWESSQRML